MGNFTAVRLDRMKALRQDQRNFLNLHLKMYRPCLTPSLERHSKHQALPRYLSVYLHAFQNEFADDVQVDTVERDDDSAIGVRRIDPFQSFVLSLTYIDY
jgi:hypothetical protein